MIMKYDTLEWWSKRGELPVILTNFVVFEHSHLQTCEILSANFKTFDN